MFPVQLRLDLQARFLEVIRTDRARTKGMYERRQFLNRDESEWFISQMNVLLQAVNEARAGFGKPPIDMQPEGSQPSLGSSAASAPRFETVRRKHGCFRRGFETVREARVALLGGVGGGGIRQRPKPIGRAACSGSATRSASSTKSDRERYFFAGAVTSDVTGWW